MMLMGYSLDIRGAHGADRDVCPIWPHSKKWGFYPIGGVSLVILIVLFLWWRGRL